MPPIPDPKSNQTNQNPERSQNQFVISPRQATSLVASSLFGAGVLIMPRTTAEYAQEAAWLSALVGGLFALLLIWIITKLGMRFPEETIVQYAPKILGHPRIPALGKILSLPFILPLILTWLAGTVITARIFGEVVVTAVLRLTPLEVIIATMIVAATVLVFFEVEVLARFNEVVFPIILFPILAIALTSFKAAKPEYILPLLPVDSLAVLQGALTTALTYLGLEIMTVMTAYTQQKEKIVRANVLGIAWPTFVYTLITAAGVAVFSHWELSLLTWPTLELVKTTEVPGLILERLESAFLGVWVAAVFTKVGNLYYVACFSLSQLLPFRKKDKARRRIAVLLLPLLYWVSLLPQNIFQLFAWTGVISLFGAIAALGPAILYLVAVIRKIGKEPFAHGQNADGEKDPLDRT
ncbi:hypothetical protein BSNK01_09110 [Bacillaceae bacterium]